MEVLKGMKLASPRGPLMIDPETRDVVQTVYVRKVEKVGEELYNAEFDNFPEQKDPENEWTGVRASHSCQVANASLRCN